MKKTGYGSRRKKWWILVLSVALSSVPLPAMAAAETNGAASMAPYVTQDMCTPQAWLAKVRGAKEELLTQSQIQTLNERITQTPETNVVDLEKLEPYFDGVALRDSRAEWESPKNLYLNGKPVEESYYEAIRKNIRGSAVQKNMPYQYGFIVNETLMKAYPYADFLSDSPSDGEWDQFAVSSLHVNEPVALCFYSKDGRYAFVQAAYSSGWIPVEDLAVCKNKEEWTSAKTMEDILVVTGNHIDLEADAYSPEISGKSLSMGTVLERVKDASGSIDGRQTWNNYVVKMPCRAADGSFTQKLALIPVNRDVSTGYLTYTTEHVLELAFKCLGDRYGWGGMLSSQDCSGYVKDIYRCFGLELPRNTTWQSKIPAEVQSLENLTIEEKKSVLNTLMPGTILQFNGHEMLYLGEENARYYVISNVSSLSAANDATEETNMLRVRSVVVNDLTTRRANGHTWMEDLNRAIKVYKPLS